MDKEKAKAAFEAWLDSLPNRHLSCSPRSAWLAAWEHREAELGRLQAELDWHKKELARVDHALVDACDRANKLQAENQKLRECLERAERYLNLLYVNSEKVYGVAREYEVNHKQCLADLDKGLYHS